jgi:vacuolar-type H+-ATPase subunit H
MSLPSLSQLRTINQLIQQIDELRVKISEAEKALQDLIASHRRELERERNRLLEQTKQRLNLDFVQSQIDDLRQQEHEHKKLLIKELEKQINDYVRNGGLQRFVSEICRNLDKQKLPYTVEMGSDAAQIIKGLDHINSAKPDAIRVVLEDKTYVIDLADLHRDLIQKLLPKVFQKQIST